MPLTTLVYQKSWCTHETKLMERLYNEMSALLERHEKVVTKFEAILDEYEHISKALAKATMNEIL